VNHLSKILTMKELERWMARLTRVSKERLTEEFAKVRDWKDGRLVGWLNE
jgi:hypothetical protein